METLRSIGNCICLFFVCSCAFFENTPVSQPPLIKTYWHQYEPFNKYLYDITDKEDAVAGCAVIALAQLLAYHKKFGDKHYRFDLLSKYLSDKDTTNFPVSDSKLYVADFIREITTHQKLLTHIEAGVSVYVGVKSIPIFLKSIGYKVVTEDFKYKRVKKQIGKGNPVLIFGETKDGRSHVWLIDGYNEKNSEEPYLHMNWGLGINYQNGNYENGWVPLSKLAHIAYRSISFDNNVRVFYVSKEGI